MTRSMPDVADRAGGPPTRTRPDLVPWSVDVDGLPLRFGAVTDGEAAGALAPGSTVRFRIVHADGRFGSSWSVQTAPESGDVYVAHREGGRWMHTSLHHDGRWHFAVTPAGQELVPDAARYLGVSTVRAEIARGWLHALRITVAESELRSGWTEAVRNRGFVEAPIPAGYDALSVDVLLASSTAVPIQLDRSLMIADMLRGDGGRAVIVARPAALDAPIHVAMEASIAEAVSQMRAFGWDGKSATRLVVVGGDPEGYLREIEIAIDPEP
jgi:hypothetical protein